MRMNLFTKSPIQFRYLVLIMIAMVAPALIVAGCLYYLIFTVTAEQLAMPEVIAANLFPVLNKINFILLVGLLPIFALLFLWGAILSHRFVGPLIRIEKDLDKILSGDASIRFKVRESDDIKNIVEKLNRLLERLK